MRSPRAPPRAPPLGPRGRARCGRRTARCRRADGSPCSSRGRSARRRAEVGSREAGRRGVPAAEGERDQGDRGDVAASATTPTRTAPLMGRRVRATPTARRTDYSVRVVGAEELPEGTAELADRGAGGERLAQRGEQVTVRSATRRTSAIAASTVLASRAARSACVRASCARSISGSSRWSSTTSGSSVVVPVDADDDALAALDVALPGEGRLLDLLLHPALLDRGDGAPELVDPGDQIARAAPRARRSAPPRTRSRRAGRPSPSSPPRA